MFRIILFGFSIFSAWRWGDWKNWGKYYPTILFFILNSMLYNLLYFNNPLWRFEPLAPLDTIFFNNTLVSLAVSLIVFPSMALIFLGTYPDKKKTAQLAYIALWVIISSLIELMAVVFGGITYHNGWNFILSVLFNIIMFTFIRLHYLKPLAAWAACALFATLMFLLFGNPLV